MTLSIMTLSIITLSIITLSIITLSIITLSIITLSLMSLSMIAFVIIMNKMEHSDYRTQYSIFMLSVKNKFLMLSVVMPSVVMLNVVAPLRRGGNRSLPHSSWSSTNKIGNLVLVSTPFRGTEDASPRYFTVNVSFPLCSIFSKKKKNLAACQSFMFG